MKKILTLIIVLSLGVGAMAQKFHIIDINTDTKVWKDIGGKVVIDGSIIKFKYPGHRLIVNTDPLSIVETVDEFDNDISMWTCTFKDNDETFKDILFITIRNDNKLEFMMMSKIEGDPYYISFKVKPKKR